MDLTTPRILQMLPVDVLSYLVEQIIDDKESLKALSQTNRAFRLFTLPRLRSHTVILDISTGLEGGHLLDPVFRTISDFNNERNFRIPSHVRVLEIRDRWPAKAARACNFQRAINEFVDALYIFLSRCIGLRKFLRDGYEHWGFKTTDLIQKVLELPKLKVLCLKIHQDRQWWFNETPKFEEYECADTLTKETGERGLACLSIGLPMSLARPWWDEVWVLCRQIMLTNVRTLKHLYFDGPDLEQIVNGMASNSLAEIRLSTLRFRMGFNPVKFRDVLGLREVVDYKRSSEVRTDAATSLRRIEFQDLHTAHGYDENIVSNDLLRYMRTPNLKRAQIFGANGAFVFNLGVVEQTQQTALDHLATFHGLEFVEFQYSTSQSWFENKLEFLADLHGESLRTIRLHQIAIDLCYKPYNEPGPIDRFSALRRLEISQDRTSFFWSVDALWKVLKTRNTISEVQIIMRQPLGGLRHRLFTPSIGSYSSLPRRILTPIYSTAFYLHNRRKGVDTSRYPSKDGELFPSTRVNTPHRMMLGDSDSDLLYINTYLSSMLYTKRRSSELALYPEPQENFGPKLYNDVAAFSSFVSGVPECLRLFQLQYVQKSGADQLEMVQRDGDAWRKVGGEWVYEKVLTELLPWYISWKVPRCKMER
ncbi:hypothetical protein TWF281_001469 [Arthrobotrys megalospora]